jgi:hypothetical protein
MAYTYEELPPRSIRLLTLHPADYADPIECTIGSAELEAVKDQYDALSYSWGMDPDGSPGREHLILLNDTPIPITQNLFEGLQRIRVPNRSIRIWIDAICINQNDNAERSEQVAKMAEIYRGARTVLVWLGEGEDTEKDKLFLNVLQRVQKLAGTDASQEMPRGTDKTYCLVVPLLDEDTPRCPGCIEENKYPPDYHATSLSVRGMKDFPTSFSPDDFMRHHARGMKEFFASHDTARRHAAETVVVVFEFFSRRYWQRRWILQELYSARRQHWYWGRCSLDILTFPTGWLDALWNSKSFVEVGLGAAKDPYDGTHDSNLFGTIRGLSCYCMPQTAAAPESISLEQCLSYFNYSKCSDPRDM